MKRRKKKFHVPFELDGTPCLPIREDAVLKAQRKAYKPNANDPGPGFNAYSAAETLNTTRTKCIRNDSLLRDKFEGLEDFRFRPLTRTSNFKLRYMKTPTPLSSRLQMIRNESLNSLYLPGDQYYGGMVEQRNKAHRVKLSGPMIGKSQKLARAVSNPTLRGRMSRTTKPAIFTRQQQENLYEFGMPKTRVGPSTVTPLRNKSKKIYRFPLVSFNETRMNRHLKQTT